MRSITQLSALGVPSEESSPVSCSLLALPTEQHSNYPKSSYVCLDPRIQMPRQPKKKKEKGSDSSNQERRGKGDFPLFLPLNRRVQSAVSPSCCCVKNPRFEQKRRRRRGRKSKVKSKTAVPAGVLRTVSARGEEAQAQTRLCAFIRSTNATRTSVS